MDQKRFLLFVALSFAIFYGWNIYVLTKKRAAEAEQAAELLAKNKDVRAAVKGEGKGTGDAAKKPSVSQPGDAVPPGAPAQPGKEAPVAKSAPVAPAAGDKQPPHPKTPQDSEPKFPARQLTLGSPDPKSPYRMLVTLTSLGASIESAKFNDPRYRDLTPEHAPLHIVDPGDGRELTFQSTVTGLGYEDLHKKHWQVVASPKNEVRFQFPGKDGLVVEKRYWLQERDDAAPLPEFPAYILKCEIRLLNHSSEARNLRYELQGPVGLPLENVENTQKFRDIVSGFLDEKGNIEHQLLTSKALSDAANDNKVEEWKRPFHYLGVDAQYFTALILPEGNQLKDAYFESVHPAISGKNDKERSDTTVVLSSKEISIPAATHAGDPGARAAGGAAALVPGEVVHGFQIFLGPKRTELLDAINAHKVIDYGMFGWISRPMLAMLKVFYLLFRNYGIAIICLTILVRGMMFPFSIKQARSAAKMQELQPELKALKEKYGKEKEKFARAQMELFSKHKYNPVAGCLPLLLQLPVFMGLYNALNHAVDLRLAKFLWIDNLAAPDALFDLPGRIPFLGWNQFNLLPVITIVLFVVQQRLTMPKPDPDNPEAVMQQKMMNFMMIFMGAMFYKVPAGLCVYFIASSLWGLAERKLLPKAAPPASSAGDTRNGSTPKPPTSPDGDGLSGSDGFLSRLMRAAEKEVAAKRAAQENRK